MITSPESSASGVDRPWASCSLPLLALVCLCIAQSALAAQSCWKIARICPKRPSDWGRRPIGPSRDLVTVDLRRPGSRSGLAPLVAAYDDVVSDIPVGSPPVPPGRHAAPGGWYPDPVDPAQERYWDGWQWSRNTRPREGTRQPGFAPPQQHVRQPVPAGPLSDPGIPRPGWASEAGRRRRRTAFRWPAGGGGCWPRSSTVCSPRSWSAR